MVGQTVVQLVEQDPRFHVAEVVGTEKRHGKTYAQETNWILQGDMPASVRSLTFKKVSQIESRYVISALPAAVAEEVEFSLAQKGHVVFSNSAAHRLSSGCFLVVPEVNGNCLEERPFEKGGIITNPNCVVAILSVVLAPLMNAALLKGLSLTTLQSASGAGYPGVPSLDLLGNVIPFISEEEEKIKQEIHHIFNQPQLPISVQCNRVPVRVGHMISCEATFDKVLTPEDFISLLDVWSAKNGGVLKVVQDPKQPQPLRTLKPNDMSVYVGRIQKGMQENQLRFVVLGDNLGRGAAGAALANLTLFDRIEEACHI